jgi:hypothetical protein
MDLAVGWPVTARWGEIPFPACFPTLGSASRASRTRAPGANASGVEPTGPTPFAARRSARKPPWGYRGRPGIAAARLVGVARHHAVEHPHHRLEVKAVALAAMAIVNRWRLHPGDNFV